MERANKPLTLEQLRAMRENTEIIGPSVLISWNGVMVYGVLDEHDEDGLCAVVGVGVWLKEKEYGKTWLAYAQQPAHIDREKWGPCDFCCREMTCETCNTALSHCGYCRMTREGKSEWKNIGTLFCRWCGRPLTEEAWEELERRVLGE